MNRYKFWSVYVSYPNPIPNEGRGGWLCIPPDEKYVPNDYPTASIRKHEEELLPPPSYWLQPDYENIVYKQNA